MHDPAEYSLSVPNSNPNSLFSHFLLRSAPEEAARPGYWLSVVREDGERPLVRPLMFFDDLQEAKDFLVDLNGPLPENHEDE